MTQQSLKRKKSLQPISREHHFGLLFCWKIRQGINRGIDTDRIVLYVKAFWEDQLSPHFIAEEELLFQDPADPLVQQALQEHRFIRERIAEMTDTKTHTTPGQLTAFTDAFESHIHFEERTLFPYLQRCFSQEQLTQIDAAIQEAYQVQLKAYYTDQFWKDPNASL